MKNKFGQSNANGAAITLIVITVIVVLYVLFLPPADRAALLEGNASGQDPSPSRPLVLLEENVGRLEFVQGGEVTQNLQSFNLRTFTQAEVVASKNNAYVKNSLFDNQVDEFRFSVDMSNTENLIFTFNARGKGQLEVLLNGKRIFFGQIDGNSPPIFLNREDLQSQNTLSFQVTSPGIMFWTFNYYELENLRIVGDVTDFSRSTNTQSISLSTRDIELLSSARLRYVATCNPNEVRDFEIKINHNTVFRGIPDCSLLNNVALSLADLYPGANFFEFSVGEGSVTVDQVRLLTRFEVPSNPLYYFDVDDRFFYSNETLRNSRSAELFMRFPNTERKRMELFLNGRIISVNVQDSRFTRDISSFLLPGTNTLEIRTLQAVDVVEMKIELK